MAAFQERLYGGEQIVELIADTYFDAFGDSYLTALSVAAGGIYWGAGCATQRIPLNVPLHLDEKRMCLHLATSPSERWIKKLLNGTLS